MTDTFLAAIFGVVEGLTEFLPVSSTAHIRLSQALFNVDLHDPFWKLFAVVIQLPAIFAVVIYFRKRLMDFITSFLKTDSSGKLKHPIVLVFIATCVTALPAFFLKKIIKTHLESLYIIGGALLIGGIVMWVVDAIYGKSIKLVTTDTIEKMSPLQAAWIGAVQILSAVFPGTSRSMSTIAGGQIAGLTRQTALEFSFFLSIPIMLLACAKDTLDAIKAKPGTDDYVGKLDSHQLTLIGIGSVFSFLVAWAVIAWFMTWVKHRGFVPFAVYRIIIGIAVLVWVYRSTHVG